jgi:hypothetical protein
VTPELTKNSASRKQFAYRVKAQPDSVDARS